MKTRSIEEIITDIKRLDPWSIHDKTSFLLNGDIYTALACYGGGISVWKGTLNNNYGPNTLYKDKEELVAWIIENQNNIG